MNIGELVMDASKKIRDATVEYVPNKNTMVKNRTKSLVGLATIGAMYVAPGDYPTFATMALAYSGIKGYQAIRDWAGK